MLAAVVGAVLAIAVGTCNVAVTREREYLAAVSPDGRYKAVITMARGFPYVESVNCYLRVSDQKGATKLRQVLLRNRDSYGEVEVEIKGMSWDGDVIVLDAEKVHYEGPSRIEIPTD